MARDPGGPWTQIDQQYVSIPPDQYTYDGTFTETNIQFRYSWYRLWTSNNSSYAPGGHGAVPATLCPTVSPSYVETLPTYLCFFTPETPLPTSTSTPLPSGVINGHLTWEGIPQPDNRNMLVTSTLVLCNGGSTVYSNANLHTDSSGNFSVITDLPDGTYDWRLKGARQLGNGGTLTISGGSASIEVGTERTGNTNSDNVVNSADFGNLKNNFGLVGVDRSSDFNFDSATNATDFNLLKNHFGQSGVAPTCP